MEQKKTNKKGILIGVIALVVLVAVFAFVYTRFSAKPVQGAKELTIEVTDNEGAYRCGISAPGNGRNGRSDL